MSYVDTFITVSEDCPAQTGTPPPAGKTRPSRAAIEYELLQAQPYQLDHLEFTYEVHRRHKLAAGEVPQDVDSFHAKGQPCMRASALVRRYGWGAHYDADGKIAIFPLESDRYAAFLEDDQVQKINGMRNKRA